MRLRIRITKRRSEDEDAKEKYYAFATVAEKQASPPAVERRRWRSTGV